MRPSTYRWSVGRRLFRCDLRFAKPLCFVISRHGEGDWSQIGLPRGATIPVFRDHSETPSPSGDSSLALSCFEVCLLYKAIAGPPAF